MKDDFAVVDFKPALHPRGIVLVGHSVKLEPLDIAAHADALFAAYALDVDGRNWQYLPYGAFASFEEFRDWLATETAKDDVTFFAITRLADNRVVGVASYLRINPMDGSIEVGHVHFSPLLQRTTAATEAMYLMMQWAFDHGYRRYEWKCNALNIKSRKAAQRLGFSYEGVFRQAAVVKGRNRNTAWFAVIDSEWPALQICFHTYLSPTNFADEGEQKMALSTLTKPLLYKVDNMECSGL